jgi:hypothetical protein
MRKIIRPVILVICVIADLFFIIGKEKLFAYDLKDPVGIIFFVLALMALLSFIYLFIVTLIERIKEIRKGENDDSGQY